MGTTIGARLRVTGNCSQGGRKHMEDMFSVAYQKTTDQRDLEYAFFGIFDGHGGPQAAAYAKDHLMGNIIHSPGFWEDDPRRVERAIRNGFLATHYGMWKDVGNWPKSANGLPSTSGTTASVVFIRRQRIYLGHVGDSAIILGEENVNRNENDSKNWKAVTLTKEHKPNNVEELERIRSVGGEVMMKAGIARVVWRRPYVRNYNKIPYMARIPFLAVARSLGDLWSYNSETKSFIVSPLPDVIELPLDISKHKCLVLCTDGLLNVLSPQEIIDLVEEAEQNNIKNDEKPGGWVNPAKHLVDVALSKWGNARADNTSAVVVLLDHLIPPKSPKFPRKLVKTEYSEGTGLGVPERKRAKTDDNSGALEISYTLEKEEGTCLTAEKVV